MDVPSVRHIFLIFYSVKSTTKATLLVG